MSNPDDSRAKIICEIKQLPQMSPRFGEIVPLLREVRANVVLIVILSMR